MMSAADSIDLQAYFERIAYEGPLEPTVEVLAALVRRHMASIPFEAIDVLLDRGIDLTPATIDRKIVGHHRGGYCFEHASLMRRALQAIGFPVAQHLARVRVNDRPGDPARAASHTSLKVDVGGDRWVVDVGFGGFMPNVPLAWRMDTPQRTDYGTFRMSKTHDGVLLESEYQGRWAPLYEILDFNWQPIDFEVANHYTATHPNSHFHHALMVALTGSEARTTIAGVRLKRTGINGAREEHYLDAEGLVAALATTFGLPVEPDWLPLLEGIFNVNHRA